MYGCELWNLNRTYVTKFITAWRKIKRRIRNLPYTTHNNSVHNLSNDICLQLDKQIVTFIYNAPNSSNCVSSLCCSPNYTVQALHLPPIIVIYHTTIIYVKKIGSRGFHIY